MAGSAIFGVPVLGAHLVHAPLHGVTAVVNRPAVVAIRSGLRGEAVPDAVSEVVARLRRPPGPSPGPRTGPVRNPLFLGLIPTRGCNMACSYCDFGETPDRSGMTIDMARSAIDAYFDLMAGSSDRNRAIHFFGGEPLFRPALVDFVVGYARSLAVRREVLLHLEISTNGFCSPSRARVLGEQLDSVVLSFDGPAPIQDRNRPAPGGRGTFDQVMRTAEILSDSPVELVIRSCVTQESLPGLVRWAELLATHLRPSVVCFERLTTTAHSQMAGLQPPDPWELSRQVVAASRVLERHGITAVTSTTDTTRVTATCCPVGQDALIVSPDGAVDACYLLEHQWVERGLDLRLGHLDPGSSAFRLDTGATDRVRRLAADHPSRCDGCISRFHCAGGCHVDHRPASDDEGYDDLCLSTRAVTIAQLLDRSGQRELADAWLASDADLHAAVLRPSDLLEGALS